jgi:tetratricopeptide (TPR) repeat protein
MSSTQPTQFDEHLSLEQRLREVEELLTRWNAEWRTELRLLQVAVESLTREILRLQTTPAPATTERAPVPPVSADMQAEIKRLQRELADLRADNYRLAAEAGHCPPAVPEPLPPAPVEPRATASPAPVTPPPLQPFPNRDRGSKLITPAMWVTLAVAGVWVGGLIFWMKSTPKLPPLEVPAAAATPPAPEAPLAAPAPVVSVGVPARVRELLRANDHAATLPELRRLVEDAPDNLDLRRLYAFILSEQGNYAESIAQYEAALRLAPRDAVTANNLAALLATCPDASLRRGADAVRLATAACQASGGVNPYYWDTLAMAYAEVGDFAAAQMTAEQALQAALNHEDHRIAAAIRTRISWFAQGLPYRIAAATPRPANYHE